MVARCYGSKETGRTSTDRQLAVDLRNLQEYFVSSKHTLRSACGSQMLADTLTKLTADSLYLHQTLPRGTCQVVRDATLEDRIKGKRTECIQRAVASEISDQQIQKREQLKKRNQRKLQSHRRRPRQVTTPAATHSLISPFSWLAPSMGWRNRWKK